MKRRSRRPDTPKIRLFQAGNFSSEKPLDDVEQGIRMYGIPVSDCRWKACTPETIPAFSSTAYFFARELHRELDIPNLMNKEGLPACPFRTDRW